MNLSLSYSLIYLPGLSKIQSYSLRADYEPELKLHNPILSKWEFIFGWIVIFFYTLFCDCCAEHVGSLD